MVDKNVLERIWQSIKIDKNYRFTYIKIESQCIPDLNLGLDKEGNRCLILLLPKSGSSKEGPVANIRRKNIELFSGDDDELVLMLKDALHSELFTDLVFAIYQNIRIFDKDKCAPLYIKLVQDWLELFEGKDKKGLTVDQVKGLLAELFVLSKHLQATAANEVDDAVKSWIGPYNTAKDFCLEDKDIEVKFKNTQANKVTISSEFQLTPEPGKELEIWVVSGRTSKEEGANLTTLNNLIKSLIITNGGSLGVYLKTLQMTGITHETIKTYDHIEVVLEKLEVYDASFPSFPSIKRTDIPKEISKVSYDLNLYSLDDFKVFQEDL
jgi:hypothetical protein